MMSGGLSYSAHLWLCMYSQQLVDSAYFSRTTGSGDTLMYYNTYNIIGKI